MSKKSKIDSTKFFNDPKISLVRGGEWWVVHEIKMIYDEGARGSKQLFCKIATLNGVY